MTHAISYNEDIESIVVEIFDVEEILDVLTSYGEVEKLCKENNADKILIDARHATKVAPQFNMYMYVINRLAKNNYLSKCRYAIVPSEKTKKDHNSLEKICLNKRMTIKVHDSYEDALTWLNQQ